MIRLQPLSTPPSLEPRPIAEIAERAGLRSDQWEPYGWYKAKLAPELYESLRGLPLAKYVNVSAINPTPLGEGKTVTAIAIAMALCRLGKRAIVTLREPSLGPLFGIKGGGTGGGRATLLPADDINLHFTGDMHAVSSAANLLAAVLDNHLYRRKSPVPLLASVTWRRAIDLCDRGLDHFVTQIGSGAQSIRRRTGFDLTPASEMMAILALAHNLSDLRKRLGRIYLGHTSAAEPIWSEQLHVAGALAALLRDALRPNLVQTCEHTPAIVHTGPFANIAHGNSSVLADLVATRLGDFVITESGFGADCGAEKFCDIKCPASGLRPDAQVLVCTVRALKYQSGRFLIRAGRPLPAGLFAEDLQAVRAGAVNLEAHLAILRQFGVPVVVAINRFAEDRASELNLVRDLAMQYGATRVAIGDGFAHGAAGAEELASLVADACQHSGQFQPLYDCGLSTTQKIERLATAIYGASAVDFSLRAKQQVALAEQLGLSNLPVCVAKTPYSLSHNPKWLGRPRDFHFPVTEVRFATGAGYLYATSGRIRTMPGLPSEPSAQKIDITEGGQIAGLH